MDRNGRKGSLVMEPTERWTPQSASDLYDVASWGKGYFSVGENGHVVVHPEKEAARCIDLDLIAYGDTVTSGETVPLLPHPRMHERAFVLLPLREIVPRWYHPLLGVAIDELIDRLPPDQAARPVA